MIDPSELRDNGAPNAAGSDEGRLRHVAPASAVIDENSATPEALKAALRGDQPTAASSARALLLLKHALEQRDAEAAQIVARLMDADPILDAELNVALEQALQNEPDSVYSFARARVAVAADDSAANDKWRQRLRVAALAALDVAISDGDDETVINWLKLVAREPESYGLGNVVRQGIRAAATRAAETSESGDLARALAQIVAKHDSATLRELLQDESFAALLPADLRAALTDGVGDAPALLQAYGMDAFLFAMIEGAHKRAADLYTAPVIEQVWAAQGLGDGRGRAVNALMNALKAAPLDWLPAPALSALLGQTLRDQRDELFHKLLRQTVERDDFTSLLVAAVLRGERTPHDALALIAQVLAINELTPQHAVDIYVGLLDAWAWHASALELAEQLARALAQSLSVTIEAGALWHMLLLAAAEKSELVGRAALRRLTAELQNASDDDALVEGVARLGMLISWSSALKTQLTNWWRAYLRGESIARLQRMDKLLTESGDGKKNGVDDLRAVAQTLLAFRRMIGKRTMQEFAADVSTAFAVLGALAESFDPSTKRSQVNIDVTTLRAELEARTVDFSPADQKILASNFKELALLLVALADNRSKASLMRRTDEVDRSLMSGEQTPHSAVDALKWMAGYLSGVQERPDDDIE